MAVCAVSALHLSTNHGPGEDPSWLELAGHHASLPLALLILYQEFRFAFADIFLKRALSFILFAGFIFGIFVFAVLPILADHPTSERSVGLLVMMWAVTGLMYPLFGRGAGWVIDKIVLKRVDYAGLTASLNRAIDQCESPEAALTEAARILKPALSAALIEWVECEEKNFRMWIQQDRQAARIAVPTINIPQYMLNIGQLSGGRRLL